MADDLGDEWWLEENTENKETNNKNETKGSQENTKKSKKSNKRERTNKLQEKDGNEGESVEEAPPKTKKKKKKKVKEQSVEMTINGGDIPEIFWSSFYKAVEGKITSLELDDIKVEDQMFITDQMLHTGELLELPIYLKSAFPKWSKQVEKLDAKDTKGSPLLLLVTCAATRATDLVRASADFRQNGKVVKLFSKHIKLEEQEKYLAEHVVHLGVGTPNRIHKLIQSGSLNMSHLDAVVLDWTWRDAKQRRLMDIPEIQQDLVTLLKDVVLMRTQEQKTKIGLF